jgi:hypothetical protein
VYDFVCTLQHSPVFHLAKSCPFLFLLPPNPPRKTPQRTNKFFIKKKKKEIKTKKKNKKNKKTKKKKKKKIKKKNK